MSHRDAASAPLKRFYRLRDVLRLIPVCKSSWMAGVKSGMYPQPVRLGYRTIAWRADDIEALITRINNGELS